MGLEYRDNCFCKFFFFPVCAIYNALVGFLVHGMLAVEFWYRRDYLRNVIELVVVRSPQSYSDSRYAAPVAIK